MDSPSQSTSPIEDVSDLVAKDLAQRLLEQDQQKQQAEQEERRRTAKIRKAVEFCRSASYNRPDEYRSELVDLSYVNKTPDEIIENTLQELASLNDLLNHALDKTLGLNESTSSLNLVDSTAGGHKRRLTADEPVNNHPPNNSTSAPASAGEQHEFKVPKAPKRLKVKPSSVSSSTSSAGSEVLATSDDDDLSKRHKKKRKKEEKHGGHRCSKHLKKKEELTNELEKVDAELKRISARAAQSSKQKKEDLQAELETLGGELKRIASKTPSLSSKHREKDLVDTIERLEAELRRISNSTNSTSGKESAKESARAAPDDDFYGRHRETVDDEDPCDKFGAFRKPSSRDWHDKRAYYERINPSNRHYLDEEYDFAEAGRSRRYESSGQKYSISSKQKYYEDDRDYDRDYYDDRPYYSSGRDKSDKYDKEKFIDKHDRYDLKDPFYMRKLKHENSVSNWTKFCSRITQAGRHDDGDNSSIESGDFYSDDDDKHSIISERFIARDALKAKEIRFEVRDFKSRQARSATEIKADLAEQFPVSSGLKHQWKEVEKPATATAAATGEPTAVKKDGDKKKGGKSSSVNPVNPVNPIDKELEDKVNDFLNKHAQPSNKSGIDIGSIMSQRLAALKILEKDKTNLVALNQLRQADDQINEWSKANAEQEEEQTEQAANTTGTADNAVPMPDSGLENFVSYKDFTKAAKSKDGVGMALLQKMGWQPGQGLGKNNEGVVEPLIPRLKLDTKGLRTEAEQAAARKNTNVRAIYNIPQVGNATGPAKKGGKAKVGQPNTGQSNVGEPSVGQPNGSQVNGNERLTQIANQSIVNGKHPVTVLQEACLKRKWKQPIYTVVNEDGPAHKKHFLMKCTLNQVDYIPTFSSPNKKLAKAIAAIVCLQAFGLIDCNNA